MLTGVRRQVETFLSGGASAFPGTAGEYRKKCDEVAAQGYEGFLLSA